MKSFGWKGANETLSKPSKDSEESLQPDKDARATDGIAGMSKDEVGECGSRIQTKCKSCFENLNKCESEVACAKQSLALTMCMASVVCPQQAKALQNNPESEKAHEEVAACLQQFEKRAYEVSG